ncbi:hypothetical protein ACIF70_39495 [Actinacidiphila glaucinigra]|uniref:hypothetical protein n=1 Tax=Actinacidiphila glaucinigra TaxID=235986 RepID=UPI0037CAABBC
MAEYRFTLARIVRTGPITAHAALNEWAHGQITVPVPTLALSQISGLTRQELAGVFEVMANCAAATDTDVDPHGWRLLAHGEGKEPTAGDRGAASPPDPRTAPHPHPHPHRHRHRHRHRLHVLWS